MILLSRQLRIDAVKDLSVIRKAQLLWWSVMFEAKRFVFMIRLACVGKITVGQ